MSSFKFQKHVLASSIAMVLAGASASAIAAEENAAANAEENIEVIEVTGIRGSNKKNLNAKKFSNSIVDVVNAEDVGKFPDSDVGEALARVPGVAVNRQFGQGQQVSIRGASNQLTLTTLNGQNVASTGWYDQQAIDRSFNYSLLPPEMVAGLEVYKSSQADLVEGGIGGTVNVITRKPLDMDSGSIFGSVDYNYSSATEDGDPSYSGLYSWKNEDETIGILGAVSIEDTTYGRRGTESLYGWGGSVSENYFEQERERTSIDVTFQYAPTENLEFALHYMNLDLSADNTNTSAFIFQNLDQCEQTNASGTCVLNTQGAANPPGTTFLQTFARAGSMSSETIDLETIYKGDSYTVTARIGSTEAEGGTDLTSNHGWFIGAPEDVYGTIDATGNEIKLDLPNAGWDSSDFTADVAVSGWAEVRQPNTDEETYAQLDVEFDVDFSIFSSIKTGVRWSDHEVVDRKDKALYANGIEAKSADTFWQGTVDAGMSGISIPKANMGAMHSDANSQITSWAEDRSGYGTVEEENIALYVMGNFEGDGYRGNVGVRYVATDASSDYYLADVGFVDPNGVGGNNNLSTDIGTDEEDYSEVLPSINVAFDITDQIIVRTSAAQVISRPNYTDMFSKTALNGLNDNDPTNQSLTKGNVGLEPFKATQFDLGVEYYYSEASMVSLGYFYKDVSNFTTFTSVADQQVGIIDDGCACDSWTVNTKIDGEGGEIEGIEFQLVHEFGNGFGTTVNYTYADATADEENFADLIGVFSDSSENTVNLVGYYENDDFSARLAYNWRSEYMIREAGFYGNRMHDDFGSLDLSVNYNVTENVTLVAQGTNILEEDSIQTGEAPMESTLKEELKNGYPTWAFEGQAIYTVGVKVLF